MSMIINIQNNKCFLNKQIFFKYTGVQKVFVNFHFNHVSMNYKITINFEEICYL